MHMLRSIEIFLREMDMPRTKFGRLAARDPGLVDDIRNGREVGSSVQTKLEHFMNKYRSERHEV